MTDDKLKEFELIISKHLAELLDLSNSDKATDKLHLQGTTMDDVLKSINELKDVLLKIKNKTFGQCVICGNGEEVEFERLEYDYATCVCLSHYSEDELRSLEKDLELTAKVQKDLLPCCAPDNEKIDIAHYTRPAGIVSGDYYDFFTLGNNKLGIVIADIMGKGLSASMLMANIQATIKTLGHEYDDVAALVTRINELFCHNMKIIHFLSLCFISIDLEKGIMEYSNAGHNPPLFWNNKNKRIDLLNPTGPAIGLIKNTKYKSNQFEINPDDMILMYTDGLLEARDNNGDEYGEDRLNEFFITNTQESATHFLENLKKTLKSFSSHLHDDVTLIALKML